MKLFLQTKRYFNKSIKNMKDAYVAQFGSKLYDMFFRRYSEKVWGLPCEKLSADWVSQRSAGLSMLEPAILLGAGAVVAFVLLAAILPIFEVYRSL